MVMKCVGPECATDDEFNALLSDYKQYFMI